MKSVLESNKENIFKTFENDSIGRNKDVFEFVRYLHEITEHYSIAIDGSWGSGKTFFVKQAKMVLDSLNPYTQFESEYTEDELLGVKSLWESYNDAKTKVGNHLCVYFDAWQYDFDEEPVLSLIYQISQVVSSAYKFETQRNYLNVATNLLDMFSGYNSKKLLSSLVGSDPVEQTKKYKGLQESINEYFNELLPEHGERLVIFIDELDRCNPKYAVKLLERIKHYFVNNKITFVFSVNLDQLQHTIKQHYGQGFDGYGYLDRFFDLPLPMPNLDSKKFYRSIDLDDDYYPSIIAKAMINSYGMSMRVILRYSSEIKEKCMIGLLRSDYYYQSKIFCTSIVLPVILGLKHVDYDAYQDFIQGVDCSALSDIVISNKALLNRVYYDCFKGKAIDMDEIRNETEDNIQQIYDAFFSNNADLLIGDISANEITRGYMRKIISKIP